MQKIDYNNLDNYSDGDLHRHHGQLVSELIELEEILRQERDCNDEDINGYIFIDKDGNRKDLK